MLAPETSICAFVMPSNIGVTRSSDFPAQQARELAHILELFDLPGQLEDLVRLGARQAAPDGALPELLLELRVAHWIGRASLAEVRPALDHGPVVELDLDQRRHLVEARGLGLRVHAEAHPL